MSYTWKPSKQMKAEIKLKIKLNSEANKKRTHLIKEGSYVEYFNTNKGLVIEGLVEEMDHNSICIDSVVVSHEDVFRNLIKFEE